MQKQVQQTVLYSHLKTLRISHGRSSSLADICILTYMLRYIRSWCIHNVALGLECLDSYGLQVAGTKSCTLQATLAARFHIATLHESSIDLIAGHNG